MKTFDQVFRYITTCAFHDENWAKVLEFCHKRFKGKQFHRPKRPTAYSTYDQFIEWEKSGLGAGDMALYGKMSGLIGDSTPDWITFVAYTDFEGKLIVKTMKIKDKERLQPLDNDCKLAFKKLIYESGYDYIVHNNLMCKKTIIKPNMYIVLPGSDEDNPNVGIWLESNGCRHHLAAFLSGKSLQLDCWIDDNYTPLRIAKENDIKRLNKVIDVAELVYNDRMQTFVKQPKRGTNNVYFYLNDRFEIVSDIDNGTFRHVERYKVGNYFIDPAKACYFMREVQKIAKEE